ncbi:MAG TPA: RNA polymerase [Micromonosporaceae bacterium]|nr:RNA polymerase [Micromonosporaceae bacterium]HCU48485.1 RNA polymerase [Micromonosporaceae bacterium]
MPPAARAHAEQVTTRLHAQHGAALRRFAYQLTGDPQRAEDLFQETLLRAWLHADKLLDNDSSQRAWLFRVARNIAIDDGRRRRARPAEIYIDETPTVPDNTDRLLSTIEMTRLLRQLSPEHRSVLVEIFYCGSTTREAAHNLRIPHGTAKSRLHYGLQHLRAKFSQPAAAYAV